MKENREEVLSFIIKMEVEPGHEQDGSYHCAAHDTGGCTKFGIASKFHPDSVLIARFGHGLKDLTRDEALVIYTEEYWNMVRGDMLPGGLDLAVADFAVNAGVRRANDYADAVRIKFKDETPVQMVKAFCNMRREFYNHLVAASPAQQPNLHDWLKRTDIIEREATEMALDAGEVTA